MNRPFHIVPDGVTPDSFIYERSEDAESDTLTCYSNSSTDTLMQSVTTATSSTLSNSLSGKPALLVKGLISDVSKIPTPNSPHSDPVSLPPPTSSNPQNQKPSHSENLSRPRSGSGDSGSSRRRGSGSDSERPMSMGPSSTRVDLPRPGATNRFSIVPTAGQSSVTNSRDIPPTRRDTDHRMQAESSRSRRLSGPVIPTGFGLLPGERVPATVHDSFVPSTLGTLDRHSPPGPGPALRTAPSGEGGKRERFSPDREMTAASEIVHERRPNGPGPVQIPPSNNFYDRERGPTRRGSQSSGSSRGHSPQDEVPRNSTYAMGPTGPIRSRTISTSRRDGSPKQIVIGGLDGTAQGIGRTVRFSERLVCPSPIPMEKRRRGWFNKKGYATTYAQILSCENFLLTQNLVINFGLMTASTSPQKWAANIQLIWKNIQMLELDGRMRKVFVSICNIASFPRFHYAPHSNVRALLSSRSRQHDRMAVFSSTII